MISGDSKEPSEASSTEGLKPGSVWSHLDRAGWGMSAAPAGPADPLAPLTGARVTRGAPAAGGGPAGLPGPVPGTAPAWGEANALAGRAPQG